MRLQHLLVETYQRTAREVEQILDELTQEDLHKRPAPGANPIGWLVWHATRSLDRTVGDVILGQQLWIRDGWYQKFNLPADPQNTGYGHTDSQVDNLKIPDVQTLLDYHHAVMKVTLEYLEHLSEDELSKEYPFSVEPGTKRSVHLRLISNIQDIQHIGQAGYARGLIKSQRWYGR
jgi:hypothetical protein